MSEKKLYQWIGIGPYKTKAHGILVGEHANLVRRCAMLNIPGCPVELVKFQMCFDSADQPSLCESMKLQFYTQQSISAFEITLLSFDLFNRQVDCHTLIKPFTLPDREEGEISFAYKIPGDKLCEEFSYLLYISAARLQDETIWNVDTDIVASVMTELNLEETPVAEQ